MITIVKCDYQKKSHTENTARDPHSLKAEKKRSGCSENMSSCYIKYALGPRIKGGNCCIGLDKMALVGSIEIKFMLSHQLHFVI
jgi:hypothetical protein